MKTGGLTETTAALAKRSLAAALSGIVPALAAMTLAGCSSVTPGPEAQIRYYCPQGYDLWGDFLCHPRGYDVPPAQGAAGIAAPAPAPPAPSWSHDAAMAGAGAGAGVIGSTVARRMSGASAGAGAATAGAAVGEGETGGAIAGAGEGAVAGGAAAGTEGAGVALGAAEGGAVDAGVEVGLGELLGELGVIAVELAPFGISSEGTSTQPWRSLIRYPVYVPPEQKP